ncbi:hypothetical protein MTO96_015514 [Rhipicephalus appendiculatus]
MFAVRLLLLVVIASPTICIASPFRVNARAAVREYSDKKDPDGYMRQAIAAGNVVQLDKTKCARTSAPLVVYLDERGREPSLLDPALFSGLVKGGRLLYLEKLWCFEARQRGVRERLPGMLLGPQWQHRADPARR